MGFGVVQTMILSRGLGPEQVGELSLIRQIALFGAQIGSFGVPMAIVYFLNRLKMDKSMVYNTSFWTIQLLSIISSLVIFVFLRYSSFLGNYELWTYLAIISFIFFSNSRSLIQSLNVASQNVKKMSIVEILPMAISVLFLGLCYSFDVLDLKYALLITVVLWPLIGLVNAYMINVNQARVGLTFNFKYAIQSLRYGSVINLSDFLIIFNGSITLFVLQYYVKDFVSVGYMSRAITLTTLINTAFISFLRILYSHWSGLTGDELKRSVEKILNILIYVSLLATVLILVCSKWMIIFLFGHEFLPAKALVDVLIFGASFYLLSKAILKLFISDGKGTYNLICLAIGASSNFLLSMVLIPKYNVLGAAYAQLISGILLALSTTILARRKYGISLSKVFLPQKFLFKFLKNPKNE